jgi:hypothetical protein
MPANFDSLKTSLGNDSENHFEVRRFNRGSGDPGRPCEIAGTFLYHE